MKGASMIRKGFYRVAAMVQDFDVAKIAGKWTVIRGGYPVGFESEKLADAVAYCNSVKRAEWIAHEAAQEN